MPLDDMNSADMGAIDKRMMDAPEGFNDAEASEGEEGLVPIPLKALAQPDDTDAMHTPEMGDNVTFTVDGTVSRIDGEMAWIKPVSVNQTPIGEAADDGKLTPEEAEAGSGDTEEDQMRNAMAGGAQV